MMRRLGPVTLFALALAACTSFGSTSEDVVDAAAQPQDAGQSTDAAGAVDASRPGEPPPPPVPPGPDGGRDRDAEASRPRAFVVGLVSEPGGQDAADNECRSAASQASASGRFAAYFASTTTRPSERFEGAGRSWAWSGSNATPAFDGSKPEMTMGTPALANGTLVGTEVTVWIGWNPAPPPKYDSTAVATLPNLVRKGAMAGGGRAYLLCLEVLP
ncbi:MAG: hypothetical protein U0183_12155 [Polyangiaceae bacterium]